MHAYRMHISVHDLRSMYFILLIVVFKECLQLADPLKFFNTLVLICIIIFLSKFLFDLK